MADEKDSKSSQSDNKVVAVPATDNKAQNNSSQEKASKKPRDNSAKEESVSPADLFNAKPMPKLKAKSTKNNWMTPTIITLLVLIALLTSSWTLYQQHLFNQNWNKLQSKVDSQLVEQTGAINQTKNSAQASLQNTTQTQNQVNQLAMNNRQLNESLLSTQERLKELSGRQKQDWMLAEVSYLIKIAQLQLTLQKDKTTAIQLLKTADSRVIEIADNNLLPIRQAIAKDLSDLSLVQEPDVVGLSYAIDAINKQIPSLEIVALQFESLEQKHNEPLVEEQQEEFSFSKIYDKFLKDFVKIENHDEIRKPLMTQDQRINLNSNIQLALQQAQIAIARGDEPLYRLNLENSVMWIEEFFKQDEKADLIIDQLNQLKSKPIEVNYPNSLNAKKALDEISQQQLYRWLESSLQQTRSSPIVEPVKSTESKKSIEEDKTPETTDLPNSNPPVLSDEPTTATEENDQ